MNKATITIIAVAFSLAIHFILFYNYEKKDTNFTKEKTEQPNRVKVTFKQTIPKPIPKVEKKKEVKKEVIKKEIVKKKIIKEVIEPKPKPKPKKKVIKKVKVVKKIVPKEIKKVVKKKEVIKKEVIKKDTSVTTVKPVNVVNNTIQKKDNSEELRAKKNLFMVLVKETINKNKVYPRVAIRRGIEGFVKIEFKLLRNGQVIDINILNGKKTFYKSTKEAISKSFPIEIPNNLKESFPMTLTLKIVYNLHN